MSSLSRAWAICAKDAAQELRRRIAIASIFFFAATAVTLVSFGIGPFGLPAEARDRVCSALLFDPPIIILDEPMIALDTDGRAIVEQVVDTHRRDGLVILASNDPRDFVEPDQVVELGRSR